MADIGIERAPRWRSTLAGLADFAVAGTAAWALRRGGRASFAESMSMLGPSSEIVRQQLRSPGQRLLGIRTIDERTGARVALWRSLAVLAAGAGAQLLASRLAPGTPSPEQALARERFQDQIADTYRRHSADPATGEAERERLMANPPPGTSLNLWRDVGPPLAVTLLGGLVRRRLVSTKEVRAGAR